MKTITQSFAMAALTLLAVAFSATPALASTNTEACAPIRHACAFAGYRVLQKGASQTEVQALRTQGKDMMLNCLKPILKGKASTVARINLDPSWDIPTCKSQIVANLPNNSAMKKANRAQVAK